MRTIKEALVLCGGKGTRLRSVVSDRAKPVAEVAGQPFLNLVIQQCVANGIERIVLATGYMSETIEQYLPIWKKSLDVTLSKEETPLGTGGAVVNALKHFQTPDFLVVNGDTWCEFQLDKLANTHQQNNASFTMLVTHSDACEGKGLVQFDETGQITHFHEKDHGQETGYINCGVYVLSVNAMAYWTQPRPLSLEKECFPKLLEDGAYCEISESDILDIGTPEMYQLAQTRFSSL